MNSINRREFLLSATAAAAAWMAGGCIKGLSRPVCPDMNASQVCRYNYVLGTQTIGAAYGFTAETRLVETARGISQMGSNIIKFPLGPGDKSYTDLGGDKAEGRQHISNLQQLACNQPAIRQVLDMPFYYYMLWAYPFTTRSWTDSHRFPEDQARLEYQEIYELTSWLLKTYAGSGKRFYLGNWEGDWMVLRGYDEHATADPVLLDCMEKWLTTRQQAVADARRDTPADDVAVYHYCEVNRVLDAMKGKDRLVNRVLPNADVDFVSYSAYDALGHDLPGALDFIESKMVNRPGQAGRRVFIGEYGFPASKYTPSQQDIRSRQVMKTALRWGCPFALYWEFYNNEVTADGRQVGYWMVDDKGRQQPIYRTHDLYYRQMSRWVTDAIDRTGRVPESKDFARQAIACLDQLPPG